MANRLFNRYLLNYIYHIMSMLLRCIRVALVLSNFNRYHVLLPLRLYFPSVVAA